MGDEADLVLHNASVVTLDPGMPRAEAVAVKDGRIALVGSSNVLATLRDSRTESIDCHSKTVIPGFNDAHCHVFALASTLLSVDCSPAAVNSISDIKSNIRARAETVPPGSWIRATGYNEFRLRERRHPNRWDLDEAAPHHPVKLLHRSRHACVLNSPGLSRIGIRMDSPEPPGGMIDRDLDSGEPSGILYDMDSYLDRRIPPLSEQEFNDGVRRASEQYLRQGITSVQDATVHNGLEQWHTFSRVKDAGTLMPRVSMMVGIEHLDEFSAGGASLAHGDDHLRLGAVKLVVTAATGSLHPGQEELNRMVLEAHQRGYQVAIHAVEEATLEAALNAIENALRQAPRSGHRHRIEHCSVCPPPLLGRLKRSDITVVTNPSFIYYSGERYLSTVPQEQHRWLYAIRSLMDNGVPTAAGSDSPVAPVGALTGIYGAVARRAENGQELTPEEAIAPMQALAMHTCNAAYASHDETTGGSITAGKRADLAVLSEDPTGVAPEEIGQITVDMTVVAGKTTWLRGSTL